MGAIVVLLYCWAHGVSVKATSAMTGLSIKSVRTWHSTIRQWISSILVTMGDSLWGNDKMGGVGHSVFIDETKFAKRKNGKGRRAKGCWVFGMVSGNPAERGRVIVVPVANRRSETLIPIIQKYVQPGTTIISDCWPAYSRLEEVGFPHLTVNHSVEFVDRETGVHTQAIESEWKHLKASFPKYGIPPKLEYYGERLMEYAYRTAIRRHFPNNDPFKILLQHIGQFYDQERELW